MGAGMPGGMGGLFGGPLGEEDAFAGMGGMGGRPSMRRTPPGPESIQVPLKLTLEEVSVTSHK
jgi:hypothetical protein